jgi:UDP-glucose 4-epimerase
MSLDNAVELVLYAFEHGNQGEIFVQKSPASTIGDLALALKEIYHSDSEIITIGTRHGEKLFETLVNREEMVRANDLKGYFKISPDSRDLNYEQYVSVGKEEVSMDIEYNSHNTQRLDKDETKKLVMKLDFIKKGLLADY